MSQKISPLAPKTTPSLPTIDGVTMQATHAGVRYRNSDKLDVLLMLFHENTQVAGTFTRSKTASANVDWGKTALMHKQARALIVNSGNANAFNGKHGEESVARIVHTASELLNCHPQAVYPCATGVIGEPLADHKITDILEKLVQEQSPDAWEDAAKAIMTTDTYPKLATRTTSIGDTPITINGIAKGSGMIAPDMATMLAYICTDAQIAAPVLQSIVSEFNEQSFNAITVDSDTSTSDTLLVFATGMAGNPPLATKDDPLLDDFKQALFDVMLDLAHQIVRDGEGATKFVTITVSGATKDASAKTIALAIANSPLVKTALAGEDPNWGRIVMAVGKSGEEADRDRLTIAIGDQILAKNGQLNPDYHEDQAADYMKNDEITIHVDIGLGDGNATVWTCDFTKEYISINADYRS